MRALAEALPENVLLILDEAYQEFVSDPAYAGSHVLALEMENVVCVRTPSKAHGLAGFRVGYGIAARRGWPTTSSGSVSLLRQPRRPGGRRSIDARQGQNEARARFVVGSGQDPCRLQGGQPELHSFAGQLVLVQTGPEICGQASWCEKEILRYPGWSRVTVGDSVRMTGS